MPIRTVELLGAGRLADVLSTDEQGRGVVDYTRFHDVVRDDGRAVPHRDRE